MYVAYIYCVSAMFLIVDLTVTLPQDSFPFSRDGEEFC